MACWYCSVREDDEAYTYKLKMFGGVVAQDSTSHTNIAYDVRHIEIPRCKDCSKRHRVAKFAKIFSVVFAAVTLCAAITLLFNWENPVAYAIILGFAAGLILTGLVASIMVQKGIKTIRTSRLKYPEIIELQKKCYRFGARPKSTVPESDEPCDTNSNG